MRRIWSKSPAWKKIHSEFGYLPHYQQIGRLKMEVKFVLCPDDRNYYTVLNMVTRDVLEYRHNGTPLNGSRGRLVGPLVRRRKVTFTVIKVKRRK